MAISHIQINTQLPHAARLRSNVLAFKDALDGVTEDLDTMALMVDGDPAVAANFGEVVTRYGVEGVDAAARLANAKALFDEVNSLKFIIASNASAAILQAASKIR